MTAGLIPRFVRYNRRIVEVKEFMGNRLMEDVGIGNLFFMARSVWTSHC